MKRFRFAPLLLFIAVINFLGFRYYKWENNINKNGRYVLGVRRNLSEGGETGASFRYKFSFENSWYQVSFVDPFFKYNLIDTLLYFKILVNNPGNDFIPLKDLKVPKCLKIFDASEDGWETLPKDTCNKLVSYYPSFSHELKW